MRRVYLFFPILLFIFGLGCSGGAESGPVTLPVPFSGTLTTTSRVFVADGLPTQECMLQGHRSGSQWQLVNSDGMVQGTVTFDCDSFQQVKPDTFTLNAAIDLNDGSHVDVQDLTFIDYVYPNDIDPGFDLSQAIDPEEVGASILSLGGAASGYAEAGNGAFTNSADHLVTHKFLYHNVLHADGLDTFFRADKSLWLVDNASGISAVSETSASVSTLASSPSATLSSGDESQVLAALFPPHEVALATRLTIAPLLGIPTEVLENPLYCEGGEVCGFLHLSQLRDFTFLSADIAQGIRDLHVCQGTSCVIDKDSKATNCEDLSCIDVPDARFVGHNITDPAVIDPILLPDEALFITATMVEHGPISPDLCTGIFHDACISGNLNLDFRCTVTFGEPAPLFGGETTKRFFGGGYVISETK